jgi:hypothetical protein
MEGGRRMDIRETMIFPFAEGYKSIRSRLRGRGGPAVSDVPQVEPAE